MNRDPYVSLYPLLNWDAPRGPLRCTACKDLAGAPIAGAYPSSLMHYEDILGPLDLPRTSARVLLVLQDPRAGEDHFQTADPTRAGVDLGPTEHRYFCLTPVAWRALKLDVATGKSAPHWPTSETAHLFLRRYLSSGGAWSYDGFLAYFLYLFRPTDALVTDLAKCHFGDDQDGRVYKRCASVHLGIEVSTLKPNLVISFTSLLTKRLLEKHVPSLNEVPRLTLFHPAARPGREPRRDRFLSELWHAQPDIERLGFDLRALADQWTADVEKATRSAAG